MTRVQIGKEDRLRDFQVKILDKFRNKKYMTCMAPRQHGKSTLIVMMIEDFLYRFQKGHSRVNPYCLVAMRTMDQAFAVIFNRLMLQLDKLPEGYVVQQGSKSSGHIILTVKRPWFKDHVTIEFVGSGNLNAVKGRTVDFLLLDEYAFMPETAWLEIFKPMIADTDGKAFVTSTVYGRNHFYQMCKSFEQLDKADPDCDEAHIEFDIYNAGVWSEDKIKREIAHHKAQNKMHIFNQEFLCDPDAIAAEEAPFSLHVGALRLEEKMNPTQNSALPSIYHGVERVYASFDIGKPTQNPIWEWTWRGDQPHIIGYEDSDESQDAAIMRLINKYPGAQIWLIYPWDAQQPSVEDGRSFVERRQEFLASRGLERLVEIQVLPKTKSKEALLFDALTTFPKCLWDMTKCHEGLVKLSAARLRKDAKTEAIDYKSWVRTDARHAADAFLYLAAAITNNLAPRLTSTVYEVEQPMVPMNNYGNSYVSYQHMGSNKYKYED